MMHHIACEASLVALGKTSIEAGIRPFQLPSQLMLVVLFKYDLPTEWPGARSFPNLNGW